MGLERKNPGWIARDWKKKTERQGFFRRNKTNTEIKILLRTTGQEYRKRTEKKEMKQKGWGNG
jgi:hypothetical protein